MAIELVKGCLLDAFDKGDVSIIGHCCNMQHVMGAGIAKQIKQRYPQAFIADGHWHKQHKDTRAFFSTALAPIAGDTKQGIIFNLYGQVRYGRETRHLHYGLIARALNAMAYHCSNETVGFNYNMGCGNAGGDWTVVYELIEASFKSINVKIYQPEVSLCNLHS